MLKVDCWESAVIFQNCPDFIWRGYFKHGKYEGMWWGHDGFLSPAIIQLLDAGQMEIIFSGSVLFPISTLFRQESIVKLIEDFLLIWFDVN